MKKKLRQQVFEKLNGRCAYCGCKLEFEKMQIDHFFAQIWETEKGNKPDNTIDNLMPSCAECNRYKSSWNIEVIRTWLENSKKKLLKTQNLRILNRMGGFHISEEPLLFHFEKFEKGDKE